MTPEFNLIKKYFTRLTPQADLGVGDDAALIRISEGHQLAISTDMSVAGTHFFSNTAPYFIGWKSLAVNVSDMAAMGAMPKWATLAIALPEVNDVWLAEFSRGFFACADAFGVALIGGDTTRGNLNISITIMGEVLTNQALRRDGATLNDDIWVSGELGSSALGLAHLQQKIMLEAPLLKHALDALHYPQPRVALGLALQGIANSCIDISDGLLADLGHILKASKLNAHVQLEAIPCFPALKSRLQEPHILKAVLAGGDDYELCFTASKTMRDQILALSHPLNCPLTRIGETTLHNEHSAAITMAYHGQPYALTQHLNTAGFDHFAQTA